MSKTSSFLNSPPLDKKRLNINWFININESQELSLSNIFFGNEIINYNGKIIVSSNQNIYVIDSKTGLILFSKNFSPVIKPFINNDYLFLITKNNLIISINLRNKKIMGKIYYTNLIIKRDTQSLNYTKYHEKPRFSADIFNLGR